MAFFVFLILQLTFKNKNDIIAPLQTKVCKKQKKGIENEKR